MGWLPGWVMTRYVRPTVDEMAGYVPGEQPKPGDNVVKLNTNESPYPPSPRVFEALAAIGSDALRRYPHPTADAFRLTAAEVHGVSKDSVLAANGSDEILAIVTRTFVGPGESIAWPDPTYSLYPVLAQIGEARGLALPWEPDWALPTTALLRSGAKAVFFANPNAPSGTLVPAETISRLAAAFEDSGIVLVDEAYVDFAEAHCLALLQTHPNLLVTRTLSKGYGLAGLRFGYALGAPELVTQMMKVKDSYNCDALSIAAASAALADQAYAAACWDKVKAERTRLAAALGARGWSILPSQANFLLGTVPAPGAAAVFAHLKARGILVRYFDKPGLADKLRITIGTPEENQALLAALP